MGRKKYMKRKYYIKGKSEGEIVDGAFDFLLILKSIFAVGEIVSGFALFFIKPIWVKHLVQRFTAAELHEDPRDLIANLLVSMAHNFTTTAAILAAIYLLGHGIIKLITLILLWKKILWAYPLSILIFIGFMIYQVIDIATTHSIFMILVTLLDVVLIALTWMEWRRMRGLRIPGEAKESI